MSDVHPQVDTAVRSRFAVSDSYFLPEGEYEYKVAYGPEGKEKFIDLSKALAPFGLTPWLAQQEGDFVLTLRKTPVPSHKASRVPVMLALFSMAVILLFSYSELVGDRYLAPQIPGYAAVVGFGASVVILVVVRYLAHVYGAKKIGWEVNTSYLIPGVPGVTTLPTLGFISYQRIPAPNRDAYFDLMVLGPAALFVASLVMQVAGNLSAVQSTVQLTSCHTLNWYVSVCPSNPSVLQWALDSLLGPLMPSAAGGHVLVSPLSDGATMGFLLAFIATLPMASFDGGHIADTLWGDGRARVATYLCVGLLIVLDTGKLLYWGVAMAALLVGGRPLGLSFRDGVSRVSRRRLAIYLALLIVAFLAVPIPHDIATIPLA